MELFLEYVEKAKYDERKHIIIFVIPNVNLIKNVKGISLKLTINMMNIS